ncbi:MAG: aspartate carbamoyltransferase catalytic subunit [Agromyces sp.]
MKHFISTRGIDSATAIRLLDTTADMADVRQRDVKKLPTLRGKTVANVFFEDSTRTRLSFEAAALALSADVSTFTAKGSSVSKGESLKDTVQTLESMGADFIVLRHSDSGAAATLAQSGWINAHVINAGDGTHEHPTQALLDAYTLRSRLFGDSARGRDLAGVRTVIVGDILHSRVARSNVWLLATLGAHITLVAPRTLMPRDIDGWPVTIAHTLDEALDSDVDAIMTLRIQKERMNDAFFPDAAEYTRFWGMTTARLGAVSSDTLVMHPGPMNRGLEIAGSIADSSNSTVRDQVSNGVAARMAVLYTLLGEDAS